MEYTVISNTTVCGKVKDEKLTKDDILSAGGNVEHLLAAGHIKAANATNAAPSAGPLSGGRRRRNQRKTKRNKSKSKKNKNKKSNKN